MSTNVIVGYSPNDFYYTWATDAKIMPSDSACQALNVTSPTWEVSCNSVNFEDNSQNCINQQLCLNKQQTNELLQLQAKTNGAEEKYDNSKTIFEDTLLTTVNLAIGIIVTFFLILKYSSQSAT